MNRPVTVRDIADDCGVHFTTVALALRNSPKVAVTTKAKILKSATRLGYRPNPLISALMAQKRAVKKPAISSVLAYVSFANPKRIEPSWFEQQYLMGAEERADELGFRLEIFRLYDPGMTASRLAQIFRTRAIYGMLLGASKISKSHLPKPLHAFSSVALSSSMARPPLNRVSHNHCQGSLLACRHLRRKGYKRIGLALTTLMDHQMDRHWSAGYLAFHEALPKSDCPAPLYLPGNQFPHELILDWVKREKPDIILTMHLQLLHWLRANRERHGLQSEMASLDLSPDWEGCGGVWQKPHSMGEEAVSFLVSQVQGNQHGLPREPITIMIDGVWVDAGSNPKPWRPTESR